MSVMAWTEAVDTLQTKSRRWQYGSFVRRRASARIERSFPAIAPIAGDFHA